MGKQHEEPAWAPRASWASHAEGGDDGQDPAHRGKDCQSTIEECGSNQAFSHNPEMAIDTMNSSLLEMETETARERARERLYDSWDDE